MSRERPVPWARADPAMQIPSRTAKALIEKRIATLRADEAGPPLAARLSILHRSPVNGSNHFSAKGIRPGRLSPGRSMGDDDEPPFGVRLLPGAAGSVRLAGIHVRPIEIEIGRAHV